MKKGLVSIFAVIMVLLISNCKNTTASNQYTVRFNVGDAQSIPELKIEEGTELDLSDEKYKPFSPTNGELFYWNNGTERVGSKIIVNNDITLTAYYRWDQWLDTDVAVSTFERSANINGIITINVKQAASEIWKMEADYRFDFEHNHQYKYKFQAWTESGTRNIRIMYFHNKTTDDRDTFLLPIDNTANKEYEFTGTEPLVNGCYSGIKFQSADTIGEFYIKIISIEKI
jgi:hypothetical protein